METFRPINTCDQCDYTWHPRGKNRSLKCPSCGSRNVHLIRWTHHWKRIGFGLCTGLLSFGLITTNHKDLKLLGVFGILGSSYVVWQSIGTKGEYV